MKRYRLEAEAAVEFDVESAFDWYQAEGPDLGLEFLEQLRFAYRRILENPLGYLELRSNIRRALTRQFPYAVYFSIEDDTILISRFFIPLAIPPNGSSGSRSYPLSRRSWSFLIRDATSSPENHLLTTVSFTSDGCCLE